jgi:hypothetical protein
LCIYAVTAKSFSSAGLPGSASEPVSTVRSDNQSNGQPYQLYTAKAVDCIACALSAQCLEGPIKPNDGRGRNVTRFEPKPKDNTNPSERMRQAIDSPKGRQLYSQRFGTVEPVFANIRHNKRLTRLNHRGRAKVNPQWNLHCMVHNIEKLSKTSMGQHRTQKGGNATLEPPPGAKRVEIAAHIGNER